MQNTEPAEKASALKVTAWVVAGTVAAVALVVGFLTLGPAAADHFARRAIAAQQEEAREAMRIQREAVYMPAVVYEAKLADRERDRSIRASIAIGLAKEDGTTADLIRSRKTQIDEMIRQAFLRRSAVSLTAAPGQVAVREEIQAGLNRIIGEDAVKAVRIEFLEIR